MKKVIVVLGLALGTLVAAALIGPSFVSWDKYRLQISEQATRLTGRQVTVAGDIAFRVLPTPTLSVADLKIANIPGANTLNIVEMAALEIRVAFLPLLLGRIQIEEIALVEPKINLEILPDGSRNWDFSTGPDAGSATAGSGNGRSFGAIFGLSGGNISLERLAIERGDLTYRDRRGQQTYRVHDLGALITAESLRGPITAEGRLIYHGIPLLFEADLGEFAGREAFSLNATVRLTDGDGMVALQGVVHRGDERLRLTGRVSAATSSAAQLMRVFYPAGAWRSSAAGALHQAFQGEGAIAVSDQRLLLDEIGYQLGAARGQARFDLTFGAPMTFDADVRMNSVQFENILEAAEAWDIQRAAGDNGDERAADALGMAPDDGDSILPSGLTGRLSFSLGALTYKERAARQFLIEAELADGQVTLTQGTALLPGGSELGLSGTLIRVEQGYQFDGTLRSSSNNMRALLSWVDVDLADVPMDRLNSFRLDGTVRLAGDVVQIYGADFEIDGSHFTGGASFGLQDRFSFSLDFGVDALNLDAYLPRLSQASPEQTTQPSGIWNFLAQDWKLLETFDGRVQISANRLIFNKIIWADTVIEATLLDGRLELARLEVANAVGARLNLTGSATNFSGATNFQARLDVRSPDVESLTRLAGVPADSWFVTTGAASLEARIAGTFEEIEMSVSGVLGDIQGGLEGGISGLNAEPHYTFSLDASGQRFDHFANYLGLPAMSPVNTVAYQIKGTLAGDSARFDINLAGSVAGGAFTLSGALLTPNATPSFDLAVSVGHADIARWITALGYDYTSQSEQLGSLALKGQITGRPQKITISGLNGNVGPVTIDGQIELEQSADISRIDLTLNTGRIDLDQLLVRNATARPKQSPLLAAWSDVPFGSGFPDATEGNFELRMSGLAYRGVEIQDARIKAHLRDRVLEIEQLTGRVFDGRLEMSGRVAAHTTRGFQLSVSLTDGNLAMLQDKFIGASYGDGLASIKGELVASGQSPSGLRNSLTGQIALTARSGYMSYLNLAAFSERYAVLAATDDFDQFVAQTVCSGQMPFDSLAMELAIEDGVVTFVNPRFEDKDFTVRISTRINLAAWEIASEIDVLAPTDTGLPRFGFTLSGPLDGARCRPQIGALRAHFVDHLGTNVLREAFGGAREGLEQLLGNQSGPENRQDVPD